jgi:hypothetical protein
MDLKSMFSFTRRNPSKAATEEQIVKLFRKLMKDSFGDKAEEKLAELTSHFSKVMNTLGLPFNGKTVRVFLEGANCAFDAAEQFGLDKGKLLVGALLTLEADAKTHSSEKINGIAIRAEVGGKWGSYTLKQLVDMGEAKKAKEWVLKRLDSYYEPTESNLEQLVALVPEGTYVVMKD